MAWPAVEELSAGRKDEVEDLLIDCLTIRPELLVERIRRTEDVAGRIMYYLGKDAAVRRIERGIIFSTGTGGRLYGINSVKVELKNNKKLRQSFKVYSLALSSLFA